MGIVRRDSLTLSPREREVLFLVGLGHTNKEIGDMLSLSKRTVDQHVISILNRLGVATRTAALMTALERGVNLWRGPRRKGNQPRHFRAGIEECPR